MDLTLEVAPFNDPDLPSYIYCGALFEMPFAHSPTWTIEEVGYEYDAPHVHADGRIEGGMYTPEYYMYSPPRALSWDDALREIEEFEWTKSSEDNLDMTVSQATTPVNEYPSLSKLRETLRAPSIRTSSYEGFNLTESTQEQSLSSPEPRVQVQEAKHPSDLIQAVPLAQKLTAIRPLLPAIDSSPAVPSPLQHEIIVSRTASRNSLDDVPRDTVSTAVVGLGEDDSDKMDVDMETVQEDGSCTTITRFVPSHGKIEALGPTAERPSPMQEVVPDQITSGEVGPNFQELVSAKPLKPPMTLTHIINPQCDESTSAKAPATSQSAPHPPSSNTPAENEDTLPPVTQLQELSENTSLGSKSANELEEATQLQLDSVLQSPLHSLAKETEFPGSLELVKGSTMSFTKSHDLCAATVQATNELDSREETWKDHLQDAAGDESSEISHNLPLHHKDHTVGSSDVVELATAEEESAKEQSSFHDASVGPVVILEPILPPSPSQVKHTRSHGQGTGDVETNEAQIECTEEMSNNSDTVMAQYEESCAGGKQKTAINTNEDIQVPDSSTIADIARESADKEEQCATSVNIAATSPEDHVSPPDTSMASNGKQKTSLKRSKPSQETAGTSDTDEDLPVKKKPKKATPTIAHMPQDAQSALDHTIRTSEASSKQRATKTANEDVNTIIDEMAQLSVQLQQRIKDGDIDMKESSTVVDVPAFPSTPTYLAFKVNEPRSRHAVSPHELFNLSDNTVRKRPSVSRKLKFRGAPEVSGLQSELQPTQDVAASETAGSDAGCASHVVEHNAPAIFADQDAPKQDLIPVPKPDVKTADVNKTHVPVPSSAQEKARRASVQPRGRSRKKAVTPDIRQKTEEDEPDVLPAVKHDSNHAVEATKSTEPGASESHETKSTTKAPQPSRKTNAAVPSSEAKTPFSVKYGKRHTRSDTTCTSTSTSALTPTPSATPTALPHPSEEEDPLYESFSGVPEDATDGDWSDATANVKASTKPQSTSTVVSATKVERTRSSRATPPTTLLRNKYGFTASRGPPVVPKRRARGVKGRHAAKKGDVEGEVAQVEEEDTEVTARHDAPTQRTTRLTTLQNDNARMNQTAHHDATSRDSGLAKQPPPPPKRQSRLTAEKHQPEQTGPLAVAEKPDKRQTRAAALEQERQEQEQEQEREQERRKQEEAKSGGLKLRLRSRDVEG